jgi:hypothetical protein
MEIFCLADEMKFYLKIDLILVSYKYKKDVINNAYKI